MNWTNIKSALVSSFLTGVAAMLMYILGVGTIFGIDFQNLVTVGVLATIPGIVSLIKQLTTTDRGNFIGAVKIQDIN